MITVLCWVVSRKQAKIEKVEAERLARRYLWMKGVSQRLYPTCDHKPVESEFSPPPNCVAWFCTECWGSFMVPVS